MDAAPESQPPGAPAGPRRSLVPLIVAAVGGVAVLGLGAALALGAFRDEAPVEEVAEEAPVEGGLKIELGGSGGDRIDPSRPLRCFVEGKLVGELTVADCAERNGVPTKGLDVGLDAEGALAAVVAVPDPVIPPDVAEPEPTPEPASDAYVPEVTPALGPVGECLRHTGSEWRMLAESLGRDVCVQLLFTGRCEPPGSATYGRWNGQTLRLVTGRVEIAPDGANFRTLVEQDASCMLP
jgi:hypothetical protein